MVKIEPSSITWKKDWIQPYESIWGIIEKFRYANKLQTIDVIRFFANKELRKKRNINPTVKAYRNLIYVSCFDSEKSKEILGLDLCEYNEKMINQLLGPVSNSITRREKYFRENLTFCPICIKKGYHSFFHQIKLFNRCVYHNVSLENTCKQCNKRMHYELTQSNDPFCCNFNHPFTQINTLTFFMSWKNNGFSQKIYNDWLNLDEEIFNKYYLYYPFLSEHDHNENHSELRMALLLLQHYTDNELNNERKNKKFIVATSRFINCDHKTRKNEPKYLELQKSYGHQKSVYDHSKAIYKSVARFIRNNLLKDHKNCIKIFHKAAHEGDICPDAFAYLLWRKEIERINELWEVESGSGNGSTLALKYNDHDNFSFYFGGTVLQYVYDTFNNFRFQKMIDFAKLEDKEIFNWLLLHMTSDLLIGRFLYWRNKVFTKILHKSFNNIEEMPFYLALIPKQEKQKMIFVRREYNLRDIGSQTCPINNQNRQYKPYVNPLERAIQNLYTDD